MTTTLEQPKHALVAQQELTSLLVNTTSLDDMTDDQLIGLAWNVWQRDNACHLVSARDIGHVLNVIVARQKEGGSTVEKQTVVIEKFRKATGLVFKDITLLQYMRVDREWPQLLATISESDLVNLTLTAVLALLQEKGKKKRLKVESVSAQPLLDNKAVKEIRIDPLGQKVAVFADDTARSVSADEFEALKKAKVKVVEPPGGVGIPPESHAAMAQVDVESDPDVWLDRIDAKIGSMDMSKVPDKAATVKRLKGIIERCYEFVGKLS